MGTEKVTYSNLRDCSLKLKIIATDMDVTKSALSNLNSRIPTSVVSNMQNIETSFTGAQSDISDISYKLEMVARNFEDIENSTISSSLIEVPAIEIEPTGAVVEEEYALKFTSADGKGTVEVAGIYYPTYDGEMPENLPIVFCFPGSGFYESNTGLPGKLNNDTANGKYTNAIVIMIDNSEGAQTDRYGKFHSDDGAKVVRNFDAIYDTIMKNGITVGGGEVTYKVDPKRVSLFSNSAGGFRVAGLLSSGKISTAVIVASGTHKTKLDINPETDVIYISHVNDGNVYFEEALKIPLNNTYGSPTTTDVENVLQGEAYKFKKSDETMTFGYSGQVMTYKDSNGNPVNNLKVIALNTDPLDAFGIEKKTDEMISTNCHHLQEEVSNGSVMIDGELVNIIDYMMTNKLGD